MKPTEQTTQCEVCQKTEGPFIQVEVSDGESPPQWLAVCGDVCLQQVILRWKHISEIIKPEEVTTMQEDTQDQRDAEQAKTTSPRYIVQKAQPYGYAIIDTTGKARPSLINAMGSLDRYERAQLTAESIASYEEHNRKVAEDWAETWNLVEQGHCGQCKRKISDIPGYQS